MEGKGALTLRFVFDLFQVLCLFREMYVNMWKHIILSYATWITYTQVIYIYITVYIHVLDIKFSIQIFKYMHKLADSSWSPGSVARWNYSGWKLWCFLRRCLTMKPTKQHQSQTFWMYRLRNGMYYTYILYTQINILYIYMDKIRVDGALVVATVKPHSLEDVFSVSGNGRAR